MTTPDTQTQREPLEQVRGALALAWLLAAIAWYSVTGWLRRIGGHR